MRFKDGHLLGLEYADKDDIELILKTAASFREVLERREETTHPGVTQA